MSEKAPPAALHELIVSTKSKPPTYTIEEIDGGKFKCTVNAFEKSAVATGTTKKLAKNESARKILQKLKDSPKVQEEISSQKKTRYFAGELNEHFTRPSSALHELAMAKVSKAPTYTFEEVDGGKFKCTVNALEKSAVAIETSKKLAKNECAKRILQKLSQLSCESSPSAALHQLMVSKQSKPPTYAFEELDGGGFKCTANALGQSAAAVATSKKLAKNESASIILRMLKDLTKQQDTSSQKKVNSYVAELSGYSAKKGLPHPEYECLPTTTKDGEFIFSCAFMEQVALGKGKSKKEAKQNAARNMIKLYIEEDKKEKTENKNLKTENNTPTNQKYQVNLAKTALSPKNIEEVVATVNSLPVSKQTKDGNQGPSHIQIVINLQK